MSDEPRTRRVTYMATGTLMNSPCPACGKDTMHRGHTCLDCERARKPLSLTARPVTPSAGICTPVSVTTAPAVSSETP
jgi:hypothetical protein